MTDGIPIRPATPDDLREVTGLLAAQLAEHDIPIERADLEFAADAILRVPERGFVLLAVEGGAAVGVACVSYSWTVERGGRVAWLDELYVAPSLREHGIGNALLARAIAVAGAAGCRTVELEVETSHARAEHLYRRHGFADLPRRRWTRTLP
ncbi:MAG TPA: GNAT family N-acetyltransferase [Longimicrobium sp.]|jgi:GNAT superfamily N-acetyltransferase|uniref:GNAT family N-acetyltransferase n=1 Tax=Longimicrobium sp. TaxID=2029185 RepID=UPI002ED8FE9E